MPELAKAKHLEYVDIDSDLWPMLSKPIELAQLLAAAAAETRPTRTVLERTFRQWHLRSGKTRW